MSRDDVPGVALTVVIGAGLLWNLLGPDALGGLVTVSSSVASPLVMACAWAAVAVATLCGVVAWWWGPVRVPTNRARWELAGAADRSTVLRRALVAASVTVATGGAVIGLIVGALTRGGTGDGLVGVLVVVGAAATTAVVGVVVALAAQLFRGNRHRAAPGRAWTLGRMPQSLFAPSDGLAASARMLVATGDTEFIEGARRIRWCTGHAGARRRRVGRGSVVRSMVVADLVRLSRRRGDLAAWLVVVVVTVALGPTTSLSTIGPAVAALLAYRAGGAVASGLRTLSTSPALGRALGVPTSTATMAHSVLPTAAVLTWAGVAAVALHGIAAAAWPVVVVGAIVATLRRATRTEPPWDAPVYVTGQGGTVQPLLMFALLRGHVAIVVTAVLACLV